MFGESTTIRPELNGGGHQNATGLNLQGVEMARDQNVFGRPNPNGVTEMSCTYPFILHRVIDV